MNENSALRVRLTEIYTKVDELDSLPMYKQAPAALKVMKSLLFIVAELVERAEAKTDAA